MARKDDDGPKKSSGVTKPTPSSTGVASRSTSGGSSSGGSKGETRKAVGGALKKVGSLVKKGLKKAVGKTARLVSKGSDKVAKKLGEDFDKIESLVESGLFKWDEIENILEHHKKDANGNTIPHEGDEVEEGYKPIDKKKETKMYRRAGNLSRDALSKGLNTKAGSKAQDKSGKIVAQSPDRKRRNVSVRWQTSKHVLITTVNYVRFQYILRRKKKKEVVKINPKKEDLYEKDDKAEDCTGSDHTKSEKKRRKEDVNDVSDVQNEQNLKPSDRFKRDAGAIAKKKIRQKEHSKYVNFLDVDEEYTQVLRKVI